MKQERKNPTPLGVGEVNTNKLRREYSVHNGHLLEQNVSPDPFKQFEKWFSDAIAAKLDLPDAMTLATATSDGIPSARMVVLRGFDAKGFCFYTDYESQKGRELAENPNAAVVFYWRELDRQVRSTGTVEKMTPEESDAYFASRPVSSQLAVCTERQSLVITGRKHLTEVSNALRRHIPPMRFHVRLIGVGTDSRRICLNFGKGVRTASMIGSVTRCNPMAHGK